MKSAITAALVLASFFVALAAGFYFFVDGSHPPAESMSASQIGMRPGKWRIAVENTTRSEDRVLDLPKTTVEKCYTADAAKAYIGLTDLPLPKGWKRDYLKPAGSGAQLRATGANGQFLASSTTSGEAFTLKAHVETSDGTTSVQTDILYTGEWLGDCSN